MFVGQHGQRPGAVQTGAERPGAFSSASHGVGKVTEQVLTNAGIKTIGDLQDHRGDLRALVGSWAPTLKRYAFGDDDRPLHVGDDPKSISSENTFLRDTADRRAHDGTPGCSADHSPSGSGSGAANHPGPDRGETGPNHCPGDHLQRPRHAGPVDAPP